MWRINGFELPFPQIRRNGWANGLAPTTWSLDGAMAQASSSFMTQTYTVLTLTKDGNYLSKQWKEVDAERYYHFKDGGYMAKNENGSIPTFYQGNGRMAKGEMTDRLVLPTISKKTEHREEPLGKVGDTGTTSSPMKVARKEWINNHYVPDNGKWRLVRISSTTINTYWRERKYLEQQSSWYRLGRKMANVTYIGASQSSWGRNNRVVMISKEHQGQISNWKASSRTMISMQLSFVMVTLTSCLHNIRAS